MNNSRMNSVLRAHPFMAGMPEKYLALIADCAEEKIFSENQYLMRFQQSADEFYLLVEGHAVLLNRVPGRKAYELETISSPGVLGWSWLMSPYRWHFDVKAKTNIKSIHVQAMCLRGKMQADPEFGCEMYSRFMDVIVDRLQAARLQGMDIYAKPESISL